MITVALLLILQEHGLTEQDIEVPGDSLKAISEYKYIKNQVLVSYQINASLVFTHVVSSLGCLPFTSYCAHRRSNAFIKSGTIMNSLCSFFQFLITLGRLG